MKLFEYESKALVAKYGIPIPVGKLYEKIEDIDRFGVVKAQVLAGKRGKAGAIKIVDSIEAAKNAASQILGHKVLEETVRSIYIEDKVDIKQEYFISFVYDTRTKAPALVLSVDGGVEIEELAKTKPDKILKVAINPLDGLPGWKARELCKQAGFTSELIPKVADVISHPLRH